MQIEVVDDHSTQDDPEAVVAELGQGRVSFYRQPQNVGHVRNFETCLERSRGRLIHLLHGDDCVRPGFYAKMEQPFKKWPELGAAFCRHIIMDAEGHWQKISPLEQAESGILNNWLDRIAISQRLQTPSMVVRREVYEHLGGFDRRLRWVEDWEMWVRVAAHYPVWYEVEPLAVYRVHHASSSDRYLRSGVNIQDARRAISMIEAYLPAGRARQLSRLAREQWGMTALLFARTSAIRGNRRAALNHIKEAWRCRISINIIARTLFVLLVLLAGGRFFSSFGKDSPVW